MSAKGRLVPVVMIPRFTSYIGISTKFVSVPLDVSDFATATLTVWRGPLLGSASPSFELTVGSSQDGVTWTTEDTSDPGDNATDVLTISIKRRYLRVSVELTGVDPAVTCWCVGALERRLPE